MVCAWNDKIECDPQRQLNVESNRATPKKAQDFQFCCECMLRQAISYLDQYGKLNIWQIDRKSALHYAKIIKNVEVLKSQWKEYWKQQESRIDRGVR